MKKWQKALLIVLSILLWIGLWTWIAYRLNKPVLLPYPKEVAKSLISLITGADFSRIVWGSFAHVTGGFLVAFVLGILLAFFSTLHETVEILLMPGIKLIKTVPVVSFIILLLFFVDPARIGFVISMLMVLPVVYENVRKGIVAADGKMLEAAKVFCFPFFKRLAYMSIPSVVPYASAACSTGLSLCWKAGIAAELIAQSPFSIGHEIYYSKIFVDAKNVFAWTIVIIIISVLFEKIFLILFRLLAVSFSAPTLWHQRNNLLRFLLGMPLRNEQPHEEGADEETEKSDTTVSGDIPVMPPSEATNKETVCTLTGVGKYYDGKQVLSNLNLSFCPGTVTVIIGPSGCGKTTLLRILLGLTDPDEGTYSIKDNARVSAVFQEDRLCEQLSAEKNVRMLPGHISKNYAKDLLRKAGIKETEEKPVSAFSGGMKRRVAWCRALAVEADLVALDEPFTGLDDEKKHRLIRLLKETQKHATIVIVTHIASEIEEIKMEFSDTQVVSLGK